MKLYKFHSFEKAEHTLDILLNERFYCASHKQLNDPFEGIFSVIEWRVGGIVQDVVRPIVRPIVRKPNGSYPEKSYKSLDDVPSLKNNVRVCSLSKEFYDIWMWTHYSA